MKLLFAGLGSIGKRHFRNVLAELETENTVPVVDAVRHGTSPLGDDISSRIGRCYSDFSQIETEYDAVFITNPTSEHYAALSRAVPLAKAVFIEKPVFSDPDADIGALNLRSDGIYYVACPLRRSPVLQRVRELLGSVSPTAVRALCSSYLPEWRSGDYRTSYSAQPRLGGGVRLDVIHEWDYLLALFGRPLSVTAEWGRFSDLEITSEDTADYLARYPDKLLTLHLDYTGRAARRELELFCEEDTVIADILNNEIRYMKSGRTERFAPADIHRAEMKYFFSLIRGETENINTVERAAETLKAALGRNI